MLETWHATASVSSCQSPVMPGTCFLWVCELKLTVSPCVLYFQKIKLTTYGAKIMPVKLNLTVFLGNLKIESGDLKWCLGKGNKELGERSVDLIRYSFLGTAYLFM